MSALVRRDPAAEIEAAYQAYRDQCWIHGCECLALDFVAWIALQLGAE